MRFLHTGDWHLGRTIRGHSRQSEFERILAEVARIARDESVDAVIIAGDTFDSFAPGAEAEKLLYETLAEIVRDGAQIVMIAGNHDSATHMDAVAGILRMVGVHSIGTPPDRAEGSVLRVPSRRGDEAATFVALPWIPERFALRFEDLAARIDDARTRYRHVMEALIRRSFGLFDASTINVLVAHILIDGVIIGQGSGERKIHIDKAFAVDAACIDDTANYVALGHVHKRQEIGAASPTYYSGSLVQLDFGEGGFDAVPGQTKYVNVIDACRNVAADVRPIEISGGRGLRTVTLPIDDLPPHGFRYGDDYLRVIVQSGRPVASLFEQVRDVLPNALDVSLERIDEPVNAPVEARRGLAPHELLARYYRVKHNADIPEPLVAVFNDLYEAEAGHAPA